MLPSKTHYNHHGLRYVSAKEIAARKKFILSCLNKEKFYKPLNSYQNKENSLSLPELVSARHEDEMKRLEERYQDFFEFPESRECQSYFQQKQALEQDYKKNQSYFVKLYCDADKNNTKTIKKNIATLQVATGTILFGAGTLSAVSRTPFAPITSSLFYIGSLLNFYEAYRNFQQAQKNSNDKELIRMILEDWHEPDRFARYDRAILNKKLQQLDKEKPSPKRRHAKYNLVRQYREKYPKTK